MPDIAMSTHIDRDCKSDPAEVDPHFFHSLRDTSNRGSLIQVSTLGKKAENIQQQMLEERVQAKRGSSFEARPRYLRAT